MALSEPQKEQILILHDGGLADVVRMLAGARAIREHHRKARITLLCGEEFEKLLKHCPYFDAVEPELEATAKQGFFDRLKAARNSHVDVIYDLGGGAAAKKIKSAARFAKGGWIDATPGKLEDGHPLDQMAAKLAAAGLSGPQIVRLGEAEPPDLDWVDFVAKRSRTLDPAYFGLHGKFALFAPVGDDSLPALRWPKERWASLAHALIEEGVEPVVIGGPTTREIGRYVAHMVPGARDLTGRADLVQLAGLGRKASFAFGEDVPLLHLLVAAGAPAVQFNAGDRAPVETAPRGRAPTVMMFAPTLAQISAPEAVQAMRCAGGFSVNDADAA
ncbi:glycosyltransferase family 9 protein [Maricaulaceae bacterium NA33B04]|nr:glycosyltransferase family 9 protein [Maricaulaceae bacterium NA33B04]